MLRLSTMAWAPCGDSFAAHTEVTVKLEAVEVHPARRSIGQRPPSVGS